MNQIFLTFIFLSSGLFYGRMAWGGECRALHRAEGTNQNDILTIFNFSGSHSDSSTSSDGSVNVALAGKVDLKVDLGDGSAPDTTSSALGAAVIFSAPDPMNRNLFEVEIRFVGAFRLSKERFVFSLRKDGSKFILKSTDGSKVKVGEKEFTVSRNLEDEGSVEITFTRATNKTLSISSTIREKLRDGTFATTQVSFPSAQQVDDVTTVLRQLAERR